jgi:metallophosphoesterase (TIGR03767 family)
MGRHSRGSGGDDVNPSSDGPGGAARPDGAKHGRSGVSRRQLLGMGAATAGVAAAGSLVGRMAVAQASPPPTVPVAPAGTTLAQTMLHGTPGAGGYRPVVLGDGEALTLRDDLLGGATRGAATRTPLLTIGQFTDMHLVDAQSPARVEFLDRFNDPGQPGATTFPFQGAYRPQEMLALHVAESMVQRMNSVVGPVTGRPIDFVVTTGDNADNTQLNEIRWHIDLLDGGKKVRPDSGSISKWEGVGGSDDHDTHYWHPNGTPPFGTIDNYRSTWGFPTVPGLLNTCRTPFMATGLIKPWYAVFGNHDGEVQGTVPGLGVIPKIAIGNLKVLGLPATGYNIPALLAAVAGGDASALQVLLTAGPVKKVTADKKRKMLTRKQLVQQYFTTSAAPSGHGYTHANVTNGTAFYSFDPVPGVHCISMDTCDTNGDDTGSLNAAQFQWLQGELNENSAHHLDASGNVVAGTGTDKIIIIFSHHTVATMTNTIGVGRVTGDKVAALFLQYPNVVVWVNGHTHRNTITPHARATTAAVGGGFWEVNTAAHIDWPEQSRVVELVNNNDGTLSIFGTILDHAAPTSWPANPSTPLELAALSRELGINDPQRDAEVGNTDGKRGTPADRNVELLVRAPF